MFGSEPPASSVTVWLAAKVWWLTSEMMLTVGFGALSLVGFTTDRTISSERVVRPMPSTAVAVM